MTQQCKYDDQLLDYLYGELAEPELTVFTQHLKSCSACAAQVESLGRVRSEYKNRPPIEPAGESMQRMTALLMQAASEQAAASKSEANPGGGGKILQFRSRGLRRILLHPAGGVMAVAAAALFWVVFRAQPGAHTGSSGPTTFRTAQEAAFEAAAPSASAPAPTPVPELAQPADKSAAAGARGAVAGTGGSDQPGPAEREGLPAEGKGGRSEALRKDSSKDTDQGDDFAGLRAKPRPTKEPDSLRAAGPPEEKAKEVPRPLAEPAAAAGPPAAPSAAERKPTGGVTLDLRTPVAGTLSAGKSASRSRGGEAQLATKNDTAGAAAEPGFAKAAKKEAAVEAERPADRWAQPPPPPPPASAAAAPPAQVAPAAPPPAAAPAREPARDEDDSVSGAIARTRDQRQQKVVEALANQELGNLGAGGAPAQGGDGRYVQRHGSANKTDSAASRALAADAEDAPVPAATAAAPQSSASRGIVGGRDDGAAALTTIKDQLRRGQCAEAGTALTRLERSQPALHGLAELRAEWQASCAAPQVPQLTPQAAPPAERRLANEALEAPAPAPASAPPRAAKLRVASPAPAKAPARAKPAAPRPSDRKAADALQ